MDDSVDKIMGELLDVEKLKKRIDDYMDKYMPAHRYHSKCRKMAELDLWLVIIDSMKDFNKYYYQEKHDN